MTQPTYAPPGYLQQPPQPQPPKKKPRAIKWTKPTMPLGMILVGLLASSGGWRTREHGLSQIAKYAGVEETLTALGGDARGIDVSDAAALAHIGLDVLIFGAALVLAGLVVIAVRRKRWIIENGWRLAPLISRKAPCEPQRQCESHGANLFVSGLVVAPQRNHQPPQMRQTPNAD